MKSQKKITLIKKLFTFLSLAFIIHGNAQIITTIAGNGTQGFSGDGGQATNAELKGPDIITFDASGNMYFTDNYRVRKINTLGIITTIAGGGQNYPGDGGQATDALLDPIGALAFNTAGNLFICDYTNNRIRMVNTLGIITTIAGDGNGYFSGDGGQATAAELNFPAGVAIDAANNIYIADELNNRIRKINNAGFISTVAGSSNSGIGDGGPATAAELSNPIGIATDLKGNLYIGDMLNHRVRMVNTLGIITTVAGNGTAGFSGDGGFATAAEIESAAIKTDSVGNIYIADISNNRIRMINTAGIITTIAGNGTSGFSGDGGGSLSAELNHPNGVAFDSNGNMYISDDGNYRIRKVTSVAAVGIQQVTANNDKVTVYPNPSDGIVNISYKNEMVICNYTFTDQLGRSVLAGKISSGKSAIDISTLGTGLYILKVDGENTQSFKVIKK